MDFSADVVAVRLHKGLPRNARRNRACVFRMHNSMSASEICVNSPFIFQDNPFQRLKNATCSLKIFHSHLSVLILIEHCDGLNRILDFPISTTFQCSEKTSAKKSFFSKHIFKLEVYPDYVSLPFLFSNNTKQNRLKILQKYHKKKLTSGRKNYTHLF